MAEKTNLLFDITKWFFQPFDWPRELYSNIRDWYLIRKVSKEKEVQRAFKECTPELRTDKIGRIYTVVNIPEEMYDKKFAQSRQTYLIDQLRKIEELTLRLGISELLYPEYHLIDDVPDSFAYLLVLDTAKDSLSIWEILKWLCKAFVWLLLLSLINNIIIHYTGQGIFSWIGTLIP